jgi:uncharacterized protein DUF4342
VPPGVVATLSGGRTWVGSVLANHSGVGRGLLFGQGRGWPFAALRVESGGGQGETLMARRLGKGRLGLYREVRSSRRVMSESEPEYTRSAVDSVVDAVRGLVSEGINRRVVVRDSKDDVVLEVPMALGVVAALAAPVATTIGAGVALVGKCEIKLEDRRRPGAQPATTVDGEQV